MKLTKKALRRRAKLCYTAAIVAGVASLMGGQRRGDGRHVRRDDWVFAGRRWPCLR